MDPFAAQLRAAAAASTDRAVLAEVAAQLSAHLERPVVMPAGWQVGADGPNRVALPAIEIPEDQRTPALLGTAREILHTAARRTATGAWFTPPSLAAALLDHLDAVGERPVVLDPACGGGAFLLAAHDRFSCADLHGMDLDPLSVETTDVTLQLAGAPRRRIVVGDGLAPGAADVDVVVANPPFLGQLRGRTTRSAGRRAELVGWFGEGAGRYVDDAALFLLRASQRLRPGGQALLIVPESLLVTADAQTVRREASARCDVDLVWRDEDGTFPGVQTCAIRLRRRTTTTDPGGSRATDTATHTASTPVPWASLLSGGIPQVPFQTGSDRLGDLTTVSATFRDTYYRLADLVLEEPLPAGEAAGAPRSRLMTVGLIDPAHDRWGDATVRFAKRRWSRPVLRDLPDDLRSAHLHPKVLVASQTKAIEAVVDECGDTVPSTPVISLVGPDPWRMAAVLTNPATSALLARDLAGSGLSRDAIRLTATAVRGLPLPPDDGAPAWTAAADAVRRATASRTATARRAHLQDCGRQMLLAYGIDGEVGAALMAWWTTRLPRR